MQRAGANELVDDGVNVVPENVVRLLEAVARGPVEGAQGRHGVHRLLHREQLPVVALLDLDQLLAELL